MALRRGLFLVDELRLARSEVTEQLSVVARVTARRPRAALYAARLVDRRRSGRQEQHRGVSDHPEWPLGLPSLRPATWSLTPPLKSVGAQCPAP